MSYKKLEVTVIGISAFLMHNGQTADPLNRFSKAMKEVSGKRKKTDADYEEMAKLEFMAGLYMGPNGPIVPSVMVEATIHAGAKKSKDGRLALAGMMVENHADLIYNGPKTSEELFKNDSFKLVSPVRIGANKVMRTRPIFHNWSANLEILYLENVINRQSILTAVRNAGAYCGFGDWRPRYGRFALSQDLAQTAQAAD